MKSRILLELDLLHHDPARSKHREALEAICGLTGEAFSELASRIKNQMLHDYSRVSIGTIDHFFQQVLRSFARESGISTTFQLELDTEFVLEKFTRYIFSQAAGNRLLMAWLTDWVNDRMDNSESWHRLESDLVRLGSELLKEEVLAGYVSAPDSIPDQDDIAAIRGFCRRTMKEYNNSMSAFAGEAASIIGHHGITVEDFSSGTRGPAGWLSKLAESDGIPNKTARESIGNPDKWVAKKKPEPIRSLIINELYPKLNDLMFRAVKFYDDEHALYNSCAAVNRNLFALGFTSFLFDFFRNYLNDNDQLLLSMAQPMISQIVGENPSPFIFEKTGNFYGHFLIDEFQDTSDLQWNNFRPLMVDSLSTGGLSMIVGDIKQSLYRWRNSNWRLLHRTAMEDLRAFPVLTGQLNENQRSRNAVIRFNNKVFSQLPGIIQGNLTPTAGTDGQPVPVPFDLNEVYSEAVQGFGQKALAEGRAEVRFYAKSERGSDANDPFESDLACLVEDLLVKRGYRQEDITFLVRRNRDGDKLTGMLRRSEAYARSQERERWNFVSADVFRIGNSRVIRMIINVMRYLADGTQSHYRDLFLWDLFLMDNDGRTPEPGFQTAGTEVFSVFAGDVGNDDLLSVTDKIIRTFRLDRDREDLPYLFQFRDQVKGCMNQGVSHMAGFLTWWDEAGSRKMLASEAPGSAMRIMTIHKAKGLSAPVIIVPFCSWEFNHKATRAPWLWVSTKDTPFSQVQRLPIRYESALGESLFADYYSRERADAFLDALNMLYVAFTRAEDVLVAFCPYGKSMSTVGDALHTCLEKETGEDGHYRTGDPDFVNMGMATRERGHIGFPVPMLIGIKKTTVSHRAGPDPEITRFGVIIHTILESVVTSGDLPAAIARAADSGLIRPEEAEPVENRLRLLLGMPETADWFSGRWDIITEAGILVPGRGERRPDRVMILGSRVVVLDYKTGARQKKHESQVREYMDLVSKLGYSEVDGYLLYLDPPGLHQVRFQEGSAPPVPTDPAA